METDSADGRSDDLVMLVREKDGGAFLALLAQYGKLFRWYFVTRGMPLWEAEDLATELIENIVMFKIDQYTGNGTGFRAWLETLMKNVAIDRWRKQKGRIFETIPETMSDQRSARDAEPEAIPPLEVVKKMQDALADLSPGDRRILEMRHCAGERTLREISEELQISETAARVRYYRAKKRLQHLLGSDSR